MLTDKKIVLGVTGGIAAYKAIALTSKLTQAGAIVKVILTKGAQQFVTPLSFQSISRQPVYVDTFDELDPKEIQHIELADWADLIVIAPATANIIGKYANGIADDMLTTTLLATEAPVYLAPAMNVHMYQHRAVQENMERLRERGCYFIDPGEGYLACGYHGKGRLPEPEEMVEYLKREQVKAKPLAGKRLLVSAGPTQETIDPVRFLTNHSSGKMGFAIAKVAAQLGAIVTLVSGPVNLVTPKAVERIDITTAEEMYQTMLDHFDEQDIVIKSAAVADYRPVTVHQHKLKKQADTLTLKLERTKDILQTLGTQKRDQYLVGFAAETENTEAYGQQKLTRKNLDAIVINDITKAGAGFKSDTNEVVILTKSGMKTRIEQTSKQAIAYQLLNQIAKEMGVDR
ncbi:bifunctional phosphopantothenoylcysteine decarboxylase/phosphopantothenate--cysteine ligase CoaBC [Amphibacillus jilinensis]|uniref:bifunctional phosphopantothenoylcysteine decarboxylase/phosphopantothenate--cysteine ligase CoaBC n=1 Tax=Amphibacillus jilinensis TaxID=1216008 RepID=UPI000318E82D|nr:bifunctional phosphopantothenoylcysteine decarboxylase/phosphopantothenate--cysteine ligase CoaBC [Amphibacillus jilinensis]